MHKSRNYIYLAANHRQKHLPQALKNVNIIESEILPSQRLTQNVLKDMSVEADWTDFTLNKREGDHPTNASKGREKLVAKFNEVGSRIEERVNGLSPIELHSSTIGL